ncbi:MAG: hypothetical protein GXO74_08105 [Calditrichaeota bacterium]|nr:hypothetical protein [Calditrichota bacterium]
MNKRIQIVGIFTVALVFIAFSLLMADENSFKKAGGSGYFSIGMSKLDIGDLNSRLAAKGYPEFSDNFLSMGGGGHTFRDKLVIGGEGFGLTASEEKFSLGNTAYKANLAVGYGFFDIGYMLFSSKKVNIFPMLGIGGGGASITIIQSGTASFDDVLSNPKRNTELSKGAFLLNLSLNAEYFITFKESKEGVGGLLLGVQAGYTIAPFTSDWKIDEYDVTGGPDFNFSGPYLRIEFGGGGMGR